MANVTYVITQESFDICFAAGVADAQAFNNMEAMEAILAPLSGVVSDDAVKQWIDYREAFVLGQSHEGISEASAGKRWTRLIESMGLTKPQSVAAAAKAAQRQRAKDKGEVASKATVATGREAVVLVAEADKSVSESARLSACIELLKHMDAQALVKAQAALLAVVETAQGDSEVDEAQM